MPQEKKSLLDPLSCFSFIPRFLEEKIKERQTTLISCCNNILDAGANLAKLSIQHNNQIFQNLDNPTLNTPDNNTLNNSPKNTLVSISDDSPMQEIENPDSPMPDTSSTNTDTDDGSTHGIDTAKIIDDDQSEAFERQFYKMIIDEGIKDLENALETENYDAMRKQQSAYTLVSSDVQNNLISHLDIYVQEIGENFSNIAIPPTATQEETESIIEINVKFATILNSYLEAIHSAHDEGFDLSNIIMLTLKHPAIKKFANNLMRHIGEAFGLGIGKVFGPIIREAVSLTARGILSITPKCNLL